MKTYQLTISIAAIVFLQQPLPAETDDRLRSFLGIYSMDVEAVVPADHGAYFFEIVVFEKGKLVARIPTGLLGRSKGKDEIITASLMFQKSPWLVQFVQVSTRSNITEDYHGWGAFDGGHFLDRPQGRLGDLLIVGALRSASFSAPKFIVESALEMDSEVEGTIRDGEVCVLIGFKSGVEYDALREQWLITPRTGNRQNPAAHAER